MTNSCGKIRFQKNDDAPETQKFQVSGAISETRNTFDADNETEGMNGKKSIFVQG